MCTVYSTMYVQYIDGMGSFFFLPRSIEYRTYAGSLLSICLMKWGESVLCSTKRPFGVITHSSLLLPQSPNVQSEGAYCTVRKC